MPHAAESLLIIMNPYLIGESSITTNKTLMILTGTDPEYSVEDYLNAITANFEYWTRASKHATSSKLDT